MKAQGINLPQRAWSRLRAERRILSGEQVFDGFSVSQRGRGILPEERPAREHVLLLLCIH
jgi:hypothetical protein